jgi:dephospho-CoA kinase
MLKVGITGGIGSGKTTVARIFKSLGIPVFHSDDEAKKCYSIHPEVRQKILDCIGPDAYDTDDEPNFPLISKRVFADEALLKKVNALIHPLVAQSFEAWCTENQKTAYVLKEAAILVETGANRALDALIVVKAPEELRIERVMKRTHQSRESVEARIRQQGSVEEALKLADYCITNDVEDALIPQVLSIHAQLIERSNTPK